MSNATHNPNEPHVVDTNRAAYLSALSKSWRAIVESAIKLATVERDEAISRAYHTITKAAAANKSLQSSHTVEQCWDAAEPIAQSAAERIIETAFENGTPHKTDDLLAAFVSAHLEHGLSAFVMSRFGHNGSSGLQLATLKAAAASQIGSRIPDRVRLIRAEFERKRPNEVERVTLWALKRRLIAWPILVYGVLSSLGGAYALYKTITTKPATVPAAVAPASSKP